MPDQQIAFVDAELRALYSALPVGVAFLGPDLRYQRVNETLARLNGRSPSVRRTYARSKKSKWW